MTKNRPPVFNSKHTAVIDADQRTRVPARAQAQEPIYDVSFEAQEGTGLADVLSLLGRHKLKIALSALGGIALGIGLAILATPTYRARTTLQLEDFRDIPLLRTSVSAGIPGASAENYLQNQVRLLRSDTLAQRVADRLGVPPVSEPGMLAGLIAGIRRSDILPLGTDDPARARVDHVKNALTVRTSLQSEVIELHFDAPTPLLAAQGANEAATQYIELNRQARDQMIEQATAWLTAQAEDLRGKIEAANQRLQSFALSSGLVFAGRDDTLAQDRMRQLQEALVRAEAARAERQTRLEAMSKSGRTVTDVAVAGPLQPYQADLQTMRRELSQLRTTYTPNHPKVEGLENQIAETERAFEAARNEAVARVQTDYDAAAGLERLLGDSQRRELTTIERQMSQQRHYEVMKSEADTTQRLYESVLEKLKEAGAASSLNTTNVRIIDPAQAPLKPYSPNLPFNAALGLAFGTLGGIGLVLLGGRSDKVAQPGEVGLFAVPELGVIPSSHHSWSGGPGRPLLPFRRNTEPGLVAWTHDASPLSESFRSTLNSILFGTMMGQKASSGAGGGRVLTVTSFDPMAGKTTIAANLAVAAAERKLRVLVIDADLRRPRIHGLFNLVNDWGLTDVLEQSQVNEGLQTAPLESLVRSTHVSNVWVLPSGPGNAAIASLLYSAGTCALLERFRNEFDLIFIDSPPLMLYSDARFLGRQSDGLVMVVRANTRSREELRAVYARLNDDRIHVVGTILNAWEMDPHQSREYGAHYYRYQQPADRSA